MGVFGRKIKKDKVLTTINKKSFANSKKVRTFANDDEPTALATDVGKAIPILRGKAAEHFLERAAKVEEEAKRRMNEPPSLEFLERELTFNKFFLEEDLRKVEERKNKIKDLENKINELKEKNGKAKEE